MSGKHASDGSDENGGGSHGKRRRHSKKAFHGKGNSGEFRSNGTCPGDELYGEVQLSHEQSAAVAGGWTAMRYHCDEGERVSSMLSFKSVFEINPFEVGRGHAAERRKYEARRDAVLDALEARPLLRRTFASLSNGEMRRVLLARALLKCPARLTVRDPYRGLDPVWREKMRALPEAIRKTGTELVLSGANGALPGFPATRRGNPRPAEAGFGTGKAVLEMRGVDMAIGRRVLFKNFSWTVREGERWLLRGPNGSGKTTLLSLATGDSPSSYAFDIRLFGNRRGGSGMSLAECRRRIGVVSSEREASSGCTVEEQLDGALTSKTRLLLLDEPCCNLSAGESKAAMERVGRWLDRHPKAAAVCVAHSAAHVPPGFSLQLELPCPQSARRQSKIATAE